MLGEVAQGGGSLLLPGALHLGFCAQDPLPRPSLAPALATLFGGPEATALGPLCSLDFHAVCALLLCSWISPQPHEIPDPWDPWGLG